MEYLRWRRGSGHGTVRRTGCCDLGSPITRISRSLRSLARSPHDWGAGPAIPCRGLGREAERLIAPPGRQGAHQSDTQDHAHDQGADDEYPVPRHGPSPPRRSWSRRLQGMVSSSGKSKLGADGRSSVGRRLGPRQTGPRIQEIVCSSATWLMAPCLIRGPFIPFTMNLRSLVPRAKSSVGVAFPASGAPDLLPPPGVLLVGFDRPAVRSAIPALTSSALAAARFSVLNLRSHVLFSPLDESLS